MMDALNFSAEFFRYANLLFRLCAK